MLLLYIHLPAFRQLSRIRADVVEELDGAVRRFAVDTVSEQLHGADGFWLLRLRSPQGGEIRSLSHRMRVFCERLLKLKQRFDEFERQIQGYNLLIDEIECNSVPAVLEVLGEQILLSSWDRDLWLTASVAGAFVDHFEVEEGVLARVNGLKAETDRDGPRVAEFCVREGLLGELSSSIQKIYLGEGAERFIVVKSDPGDGALQTVNHHLDILSEKIDDLFWVVTSSVAGREHRTPTQILGVESAVDVFVPTAFLTDIEKSVWDSFKDLNPEQSPADRIEIDLYQYFALYLSAYERRMSELLLPPIWVCDISDGLPAWAIDVVARCLRNLTDRSGVIPVVLIRSGDSLAEADEIAHFLLRTSPLSSEEIEERIASFARTGKDTHDLRQHLQNSPDRTVVALFHRLQLFNYGERADYLAESPTTRLIELLGADRVELWGIYDAAKQIISGPLLDEFLEHAGYDRDSVQAVADYYHDLHFAAVETPVSMLGKSGRENLERLIAEFVLQKTGEATVRPSKQLAEIVWRGSKSVNAAVFVRDYITLLLESDRDEDACFFLKELRGEGASSDALIILDSVRLRTAVVGGASTEAAQIFAALKARGNAKESAIEGNRRLEYTRFLYADGSFQEGLQSAKDALMIFQQHFPEREADACLFVGLHMLAVSKIDEAEAYFNIARESASRMSTALSAVSGIYAASVQFMRGNLTRALRIASSSLAQCETAGLRRFQLYLQFLVIRIQMELGRYELCVNLCLEGLCLSQLYDAVSRSVFSRWLRRCQAYAGSLADAEAGLDETSQNPEELYFLAEVLFFGGNYEKSALCLARAEMQGEKECFAAAEVIRWTTGFAMLEDRAMTGVGGTSVLGMLIRAFRAYVGCYLDRPEHGVNDLARITREDRLSEIDPSNGLYHYQYAHAIGCLSGVGDLDRLTALSKAMKYIQERASVIDDASEKQSYLHKNYWNGRILQEARESKLI